MHDPLVLLWNQTRPPNLKSTTHAPTSPLILISPSVTHLVALYSISSLTSSPMPIDIDRNTKRRSLVVTTKPTQQQVSQPSATSLTKNWSWSLWQLTPLNVLNQSYNTSFLTSNQQAHSCSHQTKPKINVLQNYHPGQSQLERNCTLMLILWSFIFCPNSHYHHTYKTRTHSHSHKTMCTTYLLCYL